MHKKSPTMEPITKFSDINLTNIKGVLLDLDDTLYCYENCHELAINHCYQHYKNNIDKKISSADFKNFYQQKRNDVVKKLSFNGSCRSRFFAFQAMFEELDITNNFELAKNYDEIYWDIFINNMNLDNEALLFLQKCQNLKINICIVTDMTAIIQIKKLQKLNVVKYIKYLVTSEEVGIEKPNHKIFQTALNKLNLSSQEVIMIGDNEEKDIKGAQFLGIKSYKILIKNSNNVEFAKK